MSATIAPFAGPEYLIIIGFFAFLCLFVIYINKPPKKKNDDTEKK